MTKQTTIVVIGALRLMTIHNIHFHGEIRKILCGYPIVSGALRQFLYSPIQESSPKYWPQGYKTFFMLNSADENANKSWHFHIY